MSEEIKKDKAETKTANQEIKIDEPNISDKDYNTILKGIGRKVYGDHKPSKATAANILKAVNGDVKKATQALREGILADRFAHYKYVNADGKAPDYKNDAGFQALADEAVNDALPTLPDARVLEQQIYSALDEGIYTEVLNKVFNAPEYIPAGSGKDFILEGCPEVQEMSGELIPTTMKNIDNYSRVDTLTLPDTIWQAYVTVKAYLYVKYFLNGKVDEYIKVAISNLARAMFKCQFYDCTMLLREAFATQYALQASASEYAPTTAHFTTTKDGFLDAAAQMETFVENMLEDNTIFSYVQGTGIQFISTKRNDLVIICDKKTKNKIREHSLSGDTYAKWLLENVVVWPEKAFNPKKDNGSGQPKGGIESVDIFTVDVEDVPTHIDGAFLIVDKKWLIRMYNLAISNAANFPFGLTEAISHFARYTQGIVSWCPIAVVDSPADKGFNSDFVLPVVQTGE